MAKKVFVSGCYDMLHSGHVAFFKSAAQYGDLYVGIGSDETILHYKNRKTVYSEKERLYMVKAIRYVTDAYINAGSGIMDFVPTLDIVKPDVFVVNTDGGSEAKRRLCQERGIEYIELDRVPDAGLVARSTTSLRSCVKSNIPYRVDLAGTWIDQPYVSQYHPGWAITVSIEPTHEFMERGGLSTSTRNAARKIWPYELPNYNEEMLARLLFCFENDPENHGHISGAQDAIGICMSGLARHYYDPMFPRRDNINILEGKDITTEKAKALADAAERCWNAILARDLDAFARAYNDSFNAQVAMFPAMMQPGVQEFIDKCKAAGAIAWKMCGAGGGGHLAIVIDHVPDFALPIKIRRQ